MSNTYENISSGLTQNLLNDVINISFNHKYIWFKNAKVASSTLSKSLQTYEIGKIKGLKAIPHPPIQESLFIKPYQLPIATLNQILNNDSHFRFTFVRNPYVRLVSAYLEKVKRNKREKLNILKGLNLPLDQIDRHISFEEFIHSIAQLAPNKRDRHWQLQAMTTCARWVKHHFIGKIETFDEDLSRLSTHLPFDLSSSLIIHTPHKTDSKQTWQSMYTSELKAIVDKVYAEDFQLFDYPQCII